MVRAFAHGAIGRQIDPSWGGPIELLFQPVFHHWCNKGCGMVHIKEPLLLIRKSSPCGGSRFLLSLSEWSYTICLTSYNSKYNVLSASLNKTFPSFLLHAISHLVSYKLSHRLPETNYSIIFCAFLINYLIRKIR